MMLVYPPTTTKFLYNSFKVIINFDGKNNHRHKGPYHDNFYFKIGASIDYLLRRLQIILIKLYAKVICYFYIFPIY